MEEIVHGLLAPTGVRYQLNYRRGVPPVVNDEVSTRMFEDAIATVGQDALADTPQSGGGEDFSWYLETVPGAMARLGVWSGEGDRSMQSTRESSVKAELPDTSDSCSLPPE